MNDYDGGFDDELAGFTDRVLTGEEAADEEAPGDLGGVILRLHRTLQLDHSEDDSVRARIRQRLVQEWAALHSGSAQARRAAYQSPVRRLSRFFAPRAVRLMAAAAVLLVVLVGVVLIVGGSDGNGLQGTASDSGSTLLPLAVVIVVGMLTAVWWIRRKHG